MSYHKFKNEHGEYGSFEVFYDDADISHGHARNYDAHSAPVKPGWYWWACFPGCLPDSEIDGPYETEAKAIEAAQYFA